MALTQVANRQRQSSRPKHPSSLDFELNEPGIPDGYLIAYIVVGISPNMRRDLIFASTRQLELLSLAKCWYVDGAIRLVRAPFTQLFLIHTFMRSAKI